MLSVELECFLECWDAFDRVGVPLYRTEMLSRGLECFDRAGIHLYRMGMLSRRLECFRQI
jgi:hypothetical protein